jgi:uncharacterized Zn finger protein (UPF0148 family)
MSTTRPRLKLDEQSFEGLLAAAFTIQRHNEARHAQKTISEPVPTTGKILETLCPHCAAPLKAGETICPQCDSEQFRPGERMQRKFASLWEMSQEQAVQLDPDEATETAPEPDGSNPPESLNRGDETGILDVKDAALSDGTDWFSRFPELASLQESQAPTASLENAAAEPLSGSVVERVRQWWHTLNLPRADLYLAVAIVVAVLAIIWPSPVVSQKPRLQPWQRILVKLGIAEAPSAAIHYRGDPNVQVWVDPHTALYYCPGEEQYGKSVNGRFTAQREAQMEQFQPAGRTTCQ